MNLARTVICGLVCLGSLIWASETYWQQDVHYTMQVHLDPEEHQLAGTSHIVYTNNSPDSLHCFYLILYPNAFKEGSVKHRESLQAYRTGGISEDNPSSIDISSLNLSLPSGAVTSSFKVDDTILEVQLPEPLAPGARLTLDLEWVHTVRQHNGRAGYRGQQYDLAQWYPKVVVYDENGWYTEPFHASGEFYGEFSTFDVTIDVPYRYVVGATGVVTSGDPGWEAARVDTTLDFDKWSDNYQAKRDSLLARKEDERRIVTFHAENVHDFAWIVSPDFVYESGGWEGIQVNVLYNLRVGDSWTRVVVKRTERAIEWLSTRFGPYQYPQITNTHGLLGGGMEYPMLVMDGRDSEDLIVHEVGHNWFYGMLGNNEMEEAWLDEGFTTFQTRWYMVNRYGPLGRDMSAQPSSWQQKHQKLTPSLAGDQWRMISLQTGGYDEPIATASYRFVSGLAYNYNAYTKASLMLESLQYILGDSLFDSGMQSYYRQWALKHTNEYRFRRAMEQAGPTGEGGPELDWFFDQWLHTAGYLDYALKGWRQRPNAGGYEVSVDISRQGSWEAPVVVEAVTSSGQRVRTTWEDFRFRTGGTVTFQSPEKVRSIVLDPDDKLMDIDRRNNHSGGLPTTFGLRPLVENYLPREEYTLSCWPVLRYNYADQLTPVIQLERRYGPSTSTPYSDTQLELGYGLGSGTFDWRVGHTAPLFLYDTRTTYNLEAFSRDGLQSASASLRSRWSRAYGLPPIYSARFTISTVDARDVEYGPPYLFAPALVTTISTMLGVERRTLDWNYGYTLTAKAGVPAPLSEYDFVRLAFEFQASRTYGSIDLSFRSFAGRVWFTESLPVQEHFTVATAGAMDYFNRPYLSTEGALYGLPFDIQKHYYLPGEGNLRGYYDHNVIGPEGLVTTTTEIDRSFNIWILGRLGTRLFLDAGVLWRPSTWTCGSPDYNQGSTADLLADFGFGLDRTQRILGQSFRLRIDFPFLLLNDTYRNGEDGVDVDFTRWLFSFGQDL